MPRTAERGGPQTRARISHIATELFIARGFDAVTVADVAKAAGVSSVTVFNHFPRKDDLLFDRTGDAEAFLREAIRTRPAGTDVVAALRTTALGIAADRSALSALGDGAEPFFRMVADSPALVARVREIGSDLEALLRAELAADDAFDGDPALLAAFVIAGYGSVMARTARQRLDGDDLAAVADAHRRRVERLFDALEHGTAAR
ncbi:TetR/AcrR family transcriptional regulator [Curtobacterium sp. RRHDQ10]|uniref:TetR/AcrR family transcriptional regulator n=1 Tax=Curtobacterium phyllosphaerae TaxID=3413379 RepID=UPI003BF1C91B